MLVAWSISDFVYPLAQLSQFVGVICIPYLLVLGMFPQLSIFKWLSCLFINYRHWLVKDKFAPVLSAWGVRRVKNITCVWARALCDGLRGNWERWGLMQTCTSVNGFRHSCLLGLGCFHPWSWCIHPWSWSRYPWKVTPWRLFSRRWLGHPWRWWSQGYASFWCWKYASFAPVSAVFNLWFRSRRHCGQLGQVGPSLEEIPEFCDRS